MSKLIYIDQGSMDDNFYALDTDLEALNCGESSDITIEEMGIEDLIAKVDAFVDQVLPQAGKLVLDILVVNELCMQISELKRRTR